jgi:heme-degrading monooxygenase HmoA
MIARVWHGWASVDTADAYQHHYETEVKTHLADVPGFRGARLLRRQDGEEVEFTSITFFTDLDAVRGFAGDQLERAVVEDAARRVLSHWDETVAHHDVTVEL